MKYKKIDKTAYQLHLIQTDRFKTTTVRVNLRNELTKEEISYRNFLLNLLTYSTEKYPTKKELVLKTQDLYALSVYTKGYRIGNQSSINFFLTYLNEKYTEENMAEQSIELFSEVLFHPNVINRAFDEKSFQIVKQNTEASLKSIKDNPARYSLMRLLEVMEPEEAYSYREYGYKEDLDTITPENIYTFYQKIMKQSLVDIYVIGQFDEKKIEHLLDKYFSFDTLKRNKKMPIIEHEVFQNKPRIIKEQDDFNQSKLSIGCKIETLSERQRNYVISLYNLILGGTGDSRFFKNIREKHSMCYYISSSVNKLDNLLLIRSGIHKDNFDTCINLIQKEMKELAKGNISDEELKRAKSNYITLLDEVYDNPEAIIETYIAKELLNMEEIETRKKIIQTVTKEEVIELAKKIKMDTIYLLEGDREDE